MIPKEAHSGAGASSDAKESVHAETPESAGTNKSLNDLLQQARDEAARVDNEVAHHANISAEAANHADRASWPIFPLMLRIAERFRSADGSLDKAALQTFLVANGARTHPNTKNPMQPLVKICCPDSKRPLVTKRGQVLAALWKRNIAADVAIEELQKSEPIGPNGALRTGMARFQRLYRQDQRTEHAATVSKTSAATQDDIEADDSLFGTWDFAAWGDTRLRAFYEAARAELNKRHSDFEEPMPPGSDTLQ